MPTTPDIEAKIEDCFDKLEDIIDELRDLVDGLQLRLRMLRAGKKTAEAAVQPASPTQTVTEQDQTSSDGQVKYYGTWG